MTKSWKETFLKDYPSLPRNSKFRFSCNETIPCFTKCCRDVNIFLTPYDVLRLKNRLQIPSREFLEKYTTPLLLADQKLPVPVLQMNDDEEKTCPFVGEEGCSVYEDRPWSCRMYPVGMASPLNQEGGEQYFLIKEADVPCVGFDEEKEWTIEDWIINQGADVYNEKSQAYKEITSHSCFAEGKPLGPNKSQMFFTTLYDLDGFRTKIFESSFLNRFEVEKAVIDKIRTDDEALLDFAFRWLRFALFAEDTVKVKGEVLEEKKQELDRIRGTT